MAIEIVDLPIENGGSFHSYVNLPEGKMVRKIMIVLLYEKTIMIMFNHQFSSNMKNDDNDILSMMFNSSK